MKKKKLVAALLLSSVFLIPANFVKADQIVNQNISGGTVEKYSGNAYGGAVLNEIGNTMSIDGATIKNNSSLSHGGAVYNEGTLTITKSEFTGNTSHAGGAVSTAAGSSLTIGAGTTFDNNHTFSKQGEAGGALGRQVSAGHTQHCAGQHAAQHLKPGVPNLPHAALLLNEHREIAHIVRQLQVKVDLPQNQQGTQQGVAYFPLLHSF